MVVLCDKIKPIPLDDYNNLLFCYLEARKVGNIIALVRGLENLRQFMIDILPTVLLNTIFSLIFVIIMAVYSLPLDGV